MKLLERENCFEIINGHYQSVLNGTGHTLFITGEAGIGKTSLIKEFISQVQDTAFILKGNCDSLFSPRPLGPLCDISYRLTSNLQLQLRSDTDRSTLFSSFLTELKDRSDPVILIFEDIHWADEATLDLIKYLARRIDQTRCLFILSYRDEEISTDHPVRTIHGEIPARLFTKLKINRLSLAAVRELSENSKLDPEHVYKLTEGNPFYVSEILASYSPGIPDNIKDSILVVFNKQTGIVRMLWEFISVLPGRIETKFLEMVYPDFFTALDASIRSGILRMEADHLHFKHELYRVTIEEALTPPRRIQMNEKILKVLLENYDEKTDLAILVHHAINAQDREVVAKFSPMAARQAEQRGAHREATRLYGIALEFSGSKGEDLADLYEHHAYECYLINKTKNAIESQTQALKIWEDLGNRIKIGSSMRLLSRFYWFEGKKEEAEKFGLEAIRKLENGFPLQERARAYSNYSQLKMLCNDKEGALEYGQKAIDLAQKINDEEILCHALNNVGAAIYQINGNNSEQLQKSLEIALRNCFHEHAARAYSNLASISIEHRKYEMAHKTLNDGIAYSSQTDVDIATYYMLSLRARYHFERCEWKEAAEIAQNIIDSSDHPSIVRIGALTVMGRLSIRKGDFKGVEFLDEAKDLALSTQELQRIIPVAVGLLEYGWLTKDSNVYSDILEEALRLLGEFSMGLFCEVYYWMDKNGIAIDPKIKISEPYRTAISGKWDTAAEKWRKLGCRYEYALSLFEGTEEARNEALRLLDQLGAYGTLEFLKSTLRAKGIKNIPRGPRVSTKNNPANLTSRQVAVLKLLKEGLQNTEIADKLFISAKTVDHHISAILSKLNVHSRTKAVVEAEKLGILEKQGENE